MLLVIDVAGGDKVPRKGGPGTSQSDLLVINKVQITTIRQLRSILCTAHLLSFFTLDTNRSMAPYFSLMTKIDRFGRDCGRQLGRDGQGFGQDAWTRTHSVCPGQERRRFGLYH